VEIVRRVFEAFNRDGPEAALAGLAPDVEYHDLPDQPDAGLYHGHSGFLAAMAQFFGELEDYSVNLDGIIDHGERIVVGVRVSGRGKSSGKVRATSNGFVVRVVWFRTREEALEAAGLSA